MPRLVATAAVLALSLAVAAETPLPAWKHLSSKNGELPAPNGGTQQTACVVFDVDGDGVNDIVLAERTQAPAIIWLRRTAKGWEKLVIDDTFQTPEAGGVAYDVDGDGDLDLIIGGDWRSDELWWYENPKPKFDAKTPWKRRVIQKGNGKARHDQAIADFKGTGKSQLMFWSQGARKLFKAEIPDNPRTAESWPVTEILDTSKVKAAIKQEGMAALDVDSDGKTDLLAGIYWFKHEGGNKFRPIQIADHPGRIAAGHFKSGKIAQIVIAPGDGDGPLWFIECKGDPTDPKSWTRRDLLGKPVIHGHSLALADINCDGHLDILCGEMAKWGRKPEPDNPDAKAWILYGDEQGNFKTTVLATGFGFHEARVADVNGDGRLDVVSKPYSWDTPRLDIWLNLGSAPGQRAARGPLRVHPDNPRYFTDGSGKAVYLTGAHTWNSLVDMGRSEPPERFDFDAYLDFLQRHNHNFIRLWAWDSTVWHTQANRKLGKDFVHNCAPLPWTRTGPGNALDGKPKFDLTRFDPAYFERLRTRVEAAGRRGTYVSVMLFEGWGLMHGNRRRPPTPDGWAWRAHPFHASNNVNSVNADADGDGITGEVHRLGNKAVNALQAAYIRKVVDTVNDFDNVLYEVINEGGEKNWDWWVVKTVRDYERAKPKQHPIGITGHGAERLESMSASPADWISPGRNDGYGEDPPAWDGRKVSLLDTDHIWGCGGNAAWVWKSFLRGHNPLFMDPYDGSVLGTPGDPRWNPIRRALGQTRRFAERMNLAAMKPENCLASTGYCLAHAAVAGAEYLAYLPAGGEVTVDLSASPGKLAVEWFNPARDKSTSAGTVEGGAVRSFKAPFEGDAVLYLGGRP